MNQPGLAVILSGPSGVGKSTICQRVFAAMPQASFSVSCTTREPRPGEVDGRDYHFLAPEAFAARRERGDFLEWAEVHGHCYGTLKEAVLPFVESGQTIILDIDVQGARQVREAIRNSPMRRHFISIFCGPPSFADLEQRLRGRGTETEENLRKRLHNAAGEMACWRDYDFLLVNDNVERAVAQFLAILQTAALRTDLSDHAPWEENPHA